MAISSIATSVRNAMCDAAVDLIDGGTTDATGDIQLTTSGDVEVALLTFANPAFGAASTGVATANSITDDTSATGGSLSSGKIKLRDRDNNVLWVGTVTATSGGGDLEISSLTVGAGDTVSISSMTVTMPAS